MRAIVILLTCLFSAQAAAQMTCGRTIAMEKLLREKHKEYPLGKGLSKGHRSILVVWIADNGTFSVVKSTPTGTSCIIDAGTDWFMVQKPDNKT